MVGRSFELVMDHKPLLGLLKDDHAVLLQASARNGPYFWQGMSAQWCSEILRLMLMPML